MNSEKTNPIFKWSAVAAAIVIFSFLFNFSFCQEKKEEYKIGALFSITGASSFLGEPEANTAKMMIEEINKKGGINGTPVKLIVEDTEGEPIIAKNKAKKLIEEDKVDIIIGPTLSGTTLAIAPDCEKAGIPLISCASSIKITEPVKKWIYKVAPNDKDAVLKIVDFCKTKNIKKAALITAANAFGISGKEQLVDLLPKNGVEIVAKEEFGANDTDASAQLTKINGTDAQAVICWGTNPGPAIVSKNMKTLGMKQTLIQSHGVASKKFIELAGDAAEGIFLPAGKLIIAEQLPDSDPQKQTLLNYIKDYEGKYKSSVSTFGGHAWDAIMMAVAGLEKGGKDKAKIAAEVEKFQKFIGISGIFNMSEKDHCGLSKDDFAMIEIKDGKWKLVEEKAEEKK